MGKRDTFETEVKPEEAKPECDADVIKSKRLEKIDSKNDTPPAVDNT